MVDGAAVDSGGGIREAVAVVVLAGSVVEVRAAAEHRAIGNAPSALRGGNR